MLTLDEFSKQMEQIRLEEISSAQVASCGEALEEVRRNVVGKKGRLSLLLRSMTSLDPADRPNAGKAANEVKNELLAAIDSRSQQLLREETKAAIEAEMTEFIDTHQTIGTDGKKQVVRNGYLPARKVQTGAGPIEVEIPRVRRRSKEPLIFTSSLVPKYMRRSVTVNVLLPKVYPIV